MWDFEFEVTESGVLGTLPTGEQRLFATENEYAEAYEDEENEIIDFMAECYGDHVIDYPDDYIYA